MAEEKKTAENADAVSSICTVSNIKTKHEPTERSNDEILRIFNKRRPYSPEDFVKHHFFEDIAENPTEAALHRQRNEFFVKGR